MIYLKTKYCIYGLRSRISNDTNTFLNFGDQRILKCQQYNYLGVFLDECLTLNSNYNSIFKKYSYKIHQFGKIKKYIDKHTHIMVYKQTILPLVEYVSFMLFFNRACDIEKLQRLQNRCLHMCLDINNPRDMSVLRVHEACTVSYLATRRYNHLAKLMYTLTQNNKYRKEGNHTTRTINTYIFDTDIVHLGLYSNSPYYKGAKLWNELPLEIKETRLKSTFTFLVKRHLFILMNT